MRPLPLSSRTLPFIVSFSLTVVPLLLFPAGARADLILGAEVRVTLEDNVVGLLSGGGGSGTGGTMMGGPVAQAGGKGFGSGPGAGTAPGGSGSYTGDGSRSAGDLSLTISAEAGAETRPEGRVSLFALGFAERTDYHELSAFDQSSAGASAGAAVRLAGPVSCRMTATGRVRRYDNDPDRDGTSVLGSLGLKQAVASWLFVRETAEYEAYRAAEQDFSFRGAAFRFVAGSSLNDDLLLTAGYRFQAQQYQDASATVLRSGTSSAGLDYAFSRRWSALLSYERQVTQAGAADTITRNNISSLALRWDY